SAFDGAARCPVLSPKSIETMFACPDGDLGHDKDGAPKKTYYGCGWRIRPVEKDRVNTWHAGLLAGTSTLLVRRYDGLTWAVLFNGSTPGERPPATDIDPLVHKAVDAVKVWP